jgi:hypothetical protein
MPFEDVVCTFLSALPRSLEQKARHDVLDASHSGGDIDEAIPDPIPNSEVKLVGADGTARVILWESRTLPGLSCWTRNPPRFRALEGFLLLSPALLEAAARTPGLGDASLASPRTPRERDDALGAGAAGRGATDGARRWLVRDSTDFGHFGHPVGARRIGAIVRRRTELESDRVACRVSVRRRRDGARGASAQVGPVRFSCRPMPRTRRMRGSPRQGDPPLADRQRWALTWCVSSRPSQARVAKSMTKRYRTSPFSMRT